MQLGLRIGMHNKWRYCNILGTAVPDFRARAFHILLLLNFKALHEHIPVQAIVQIFLTGYLLKNSERLYIIKVSSCKCIFICTGKVFCVDKHGGKFSQFFLKSVAFRLSTVSCVLFFTTIPDISLDCYMNIYFTSHNIRIFCN